MERREENVWPSSDAANAHGSSEHYSSRKDVASKQMLKSSNTEIFSRVNESSRDSQHSRSGWQHMNTSINHFDNLHKREVSARPSAPQTKVQDPRPSRRVHGEHTKPSQYMHREVSLAEDVCYILSKVALTTIPILLLDDPFKMTTPTCMGDSNVSESSHEIDNQNVQYDSVSILGSSITTLPCEDDNDISNQSISSSSVFDLVREAYAKHHRNHKQRSPSQSPLSSSESTPPKLFIQKVPRRRSQRLENSSIRRSMQTPEFRKFIYELLRKTRMSSVALLLALKYIHRLRLNHPHARPSHGCEYRLFSVALILANKYLEDKTFSNKTWSSLTRIQVHEINVMEREFLNILDYHLDIPDDEFIAWTEYVEHIFQLSQNEGDTFPQNVETI